MSLDVAPAQGTDYYLMDELLTEQERRTRDKVRAFCDA
jgi:glutaryl-CoA dehydrogenase